MAGSIYRIYRDFFFFRPDCNFNANSERLFCQEERFYLVLFFFSYLLIAFALIAIDIASNRWRGLRAATRSADLLIETVIFPTVLQCTVKF